jgi:hypothetical protein
MNEKLDTNESEQLAELSVEALAARLDTNTVICPPPGCSVTVCTCF